MPKSDQGVTNDRYMVIPRSLIFIFREGEVLLIKGSPQKRLWANLYNGIGGHIERGEDLLSAARRELKEETGVETKILTLCGLILVDASPQTGVGIFLYRGVYEGGDLKPSSEGELEWISVTKLDSFPLVDDLREILPRVWKWRPGSPILIGRSYYDDAERLCVEFTQ